MVTLLHQNDADVNTVGGEFKETPLHIAAIQNHEHMVRLLLSNGADATKKDQHDETPLDYTKEKQVHTLIQEWLTMQSFLALACANKRTNPFLPTELLDMIAATIGLDTTRIPFSISSTAAIANANAAAEAAADAAANDGTPTATLSGNSMVPLSRGDGNAIV